MNKFLIFIIKIRFSFNAFEPSRNASNKTKISQRKKGGREKSVIKYAQVSLVAASDPPSSAASANMHESPISAYLDQPREYRSRVNGFEQSHPMRSSVDTPPPPGPLATGPRHPTRLIGSFPKGSELNWDVNKTRAGHPPPGSYQQTSTIKTCTRCRERAGEGWGGARFRGPEQPSDNHAAIKRIKLIEG